MEITQEVALHTLIEQQAVRQLRSRGSRMSELAQDEQGISRLGWVSIVPSLLRRPTLLAEVEQEAREIWQQGIRHIIWAGMGGSITMVHVLTKMGFCQGREGGLTLYPLDSTDPAALNGVVRAIARAKKLPLSFDRSLDGMEKRQLFGDVLLIAVSMSTMSEEACTHVVWFLNILRNAQLSPEKHLLVLPLAHSLLHRVAQERHLPTRSPFLTLQRFAGRMSAPGSRIFLLPVAFHCVQQEERGYLAAILRQAWEWYDVALAEQHPDQHVFVQLACALFGASDRGVCRLLLDLPEQWQLFSAWIEQLLEQSLGKSGKGIVVFHPQKLNPAVPGYQATNLLRVQVAPAPLENPGVHVVVQPSLVSLSPADPITSLAAIAATCLSWQLTMALYAFLGQIAFATEPAVEHYKRLARRLKTLPDPLADLTHETVLVFSRGGVSRRLVSMVSQALYAALIRGDLQYLDVTMNGEPSSTLLQVVTKHLQRLANAVLGVPWKLRIAPAAYHISEQCQMDGPPLVSMRVLLRKQTTPLIEPYDTAYMYAQAVATWQAMNEAGRPCFLFLLEEEASTPDGAVEALDRFFAQVCQKVLLSFVFAE